MWFDFSKNCCNVYRIDHMSLFDNKFFYVFPVSSVTGACLRAFHVFTTLLTCVSVSCLFWKKKLSLAWALDECLHWQQWTSLPKKVSIRGKYFFINLILLMCCQFAAAHTVSSTVLEWTLPGSMQKRKLPKRLMIQNQFLNHRTWNLTFQRSFHVPCFMLSLCSWKTHFSNWRLLWNLMNIREFFIWNRKGKVCASVHRRR